MANIFNTIWRIFIGLISVGIILVIVLLITGTVMFFSSRALMQKIKEYRKISRTLLSSLGDEPVSIAGKFYQVDVVTHEEKMQEIARMRQDVLTTYDSLTKSQKKRFLGDSDIEEIRAECDKE